MLRRVGGLKNRIRWRDLILAALNRRVMLPQLISQIHVREMVIGDGEMD